MRPAARHEELVVEDPIVLVGDLLVDDVLVLGLRHHQQVLERVVQVAAVVHVDVGRPAVPPLGRHVGHPAKINDDGCDRVGRRLDGNRFRPVLEPFDDGHLRATGGHLHRERAAVMKDMVVLGADTGVGVGRRVELAV